MPRKSVAGSVSVRTRHMAAAGASSTGRVTSKEEEQKRASLGTMTGRSHYAARRRRGATLRQGRGAVASTWRSHQNRYPDMENALEESRDEENFLENAAEPKSRTSSGPGASSEHDGNSGCKCKAGCRCPSAAVGFSEQPEAKIEPEGPEEIDSSSNIYPYSICDDCRARLGKDFDCRAESCAMALLELRYGAAARETTLASGDGAHHGEPEEPMVHLPGPSARPSGSRARRTQPKPLHRTLVSSGAGDAEQSMGSLLKGVAKRRRKCSCCAAGTSIGCQNCCTPLNAATLGSGSSGRSATVSRPSTSAAAGAPFEPQGSSDGSTTAPVIQLPARDEAGAEPNSNPPSVAAPVAILPALVLSEESNKPSENEECPSRE